ncbi:MAG: nitroreductase family protein [Xanthomonadales bacterium]|nr:nitroreductase family protein [Xanthomonadales bacterium]
MNAAKPAPIEHQIHPVIAGRWSARAIDPHKPVARADLLRMLEAARWAPSCFGDEPWRFLVWDKTRDPEGWEQAASILAEKNQRWARNAPVLIASLADGQFGRNDKPNRWAQYDTGAASVSLHMQGVDLGLVVHQMGGFDKARLAEVFDIPERFTAMAMIAVGHPAPATTLDEDFRDGETGPRDRKSMSEIAFEGRMDRPLDD